MKTSYVEDFSYAIDDVVARYDFSCTKETLADANDFAQRMTKEFKQYHTAIKGKDGSWIITNKYDPRIDLTLPQRKHIQLT